MKTAFLLLVTLLLSLPVTAALADEPREVEAGKQYEVFTSIPRNSGGERNSFLLIILKLAGDEHSPLVAIIDESARTTSVEICGTHVVKVVKVGNLLEAHFFHRAEDTPFYRLPVKAYKEVLP